MTAGDLPDGLLAGVAELPADGRLAADGLDRLDRLATPCRPTRCRQQACRQLAVTMLLVSGVRWPECMYRLSATSVSGEQAKRIRSRSAALIRSRIGSPWPAEYRDPG